MDDRNIFIKEKLQNYLLRHQKKDVKKKKAQEECMTLSALNVYNKTIFSLYLATLSPLIVAILRLGVQIALPFQ